MIREILNFNFTQKMRKDLSNEMCLTMPRSPDWTGTMFYLCVPLLIMLLIQVILYTLL